MSDQFKVIIRSKPVRTYSQAFKRKVVAEFERGGVTKDALQRKYGIGGNTAVHDWCLLYGTLDHSKLDKGKRGRPLLDPQLRKIKELEAALAQETAMRKQAELKVLAYQKLIEIAERDHHIDLKKDGAKPSKN